MAGDFNIQWGKRLFTSMSFLRKVSKKGQVTIQYRTHVHEMRHFLQQEHTPSKGDTL